MVVSERLLEIAELLATNPLAAADRIDKLADDLRELARRVRAQPTTQGWVSQGGVCERVQIEVVGPDGTVQQKVDTGVTE